MAAAEGTFIPWFKPLILQMREAEVFGGYVRGQMVGEWQSQGESFLPRGTVHIEWNLDGILYNTSLSQGG